MIARIKNSLRRRIHDWTRYKIPTPSLSATDWDKHEVSRQILQAFPYFTPHGGYSGVTDLHFQDRELKGAVACTPSEATLLHLAAKHLQPLRPLEIGSYMGWSSAHIASAIDQPLACVDPFVEIGPDLRETTSEPARQRFFSNMERSGLTAKIKLHCEKSPDVLSSIAPEGGWDFAFVDGWHLNDQPTRDLVGLLPFVSPHAIVILHDIWVRDVRDALLYILTQGFNAYICDTANFLTFCWRGPIPANLHRALLSPTWATLDNIGAHAHRITYGLKASSLNQFAAQFGTRVFDRATAREIPASTT